MVSVSPAGDKNAHMVAPLMGKDTHYVSCGYTPNGFDEVNANGSRYNQMSFGCLSKTVAVFLWGAVFLGLSGCLLSEASLASPLAAKAIADSAQTIAPTVPAFSGKASSVLRISNSDLLQRQQLERSIQSAAFQQFGSHRTGRLYNVSVAGIPVGDVRAVRLRSGSFKRYGITLNEFAIPDGCIVYPIPERILLVYTKFSNASLFQSVPAGYVLASPVLSVLVYDASNLNSTQAPRQISVATTGKLISIRFPLNQGLQCAYFSDNSTTVSISDSVQGTCQSDRLGFFGAVRSGSAPAPSPALPEVGKTLPRRPGKHSNTWKIIVGAVVGGSALLALLTAVALGIRKRRKDAKLSRMEQQTELGETLHMATIRNSRVPTAMNTRTQASLVNDYTV